MNCDGAAGPGTGATEAGTSWQKQGETNTNEFVSAINHAMKRKRNLRNESKYSFLLHPLSEWCIPQASSCAAKSKS